jgi:hypothetical protein
LDISCFTHRVTHLLSPNHSRFLSRFSFKSTNVEAYEVALLSLSYLLAVLLSFLIPSKQQKPSASGAASPGSTPARGSSSTGVPREATLLQDDLKALMKVEMRSAVWQHQDVLRIFCPESSSAAVLMDLRKKKIGPKFKKIFQSEGKPGEGGYYQPFAQLFAQVQTCTAKYVPNCYHAKGLRQPSRRVRRSRPSSQARPGSRSSTGYMTVLARYLHSDRSEG